MIARFEFRHKPNRFDKHEWQGSFQNEPMVGDWTLTVSDNSSAHGSGQITAFEIYVNQ